MKLLEKEFKRPHTVDLVPCMWFSTNNIDLHSIEWELTMFINIRVLKLRSID